MRSHREVFLFLIFLTISGQIISAQNVSKNESASTIYKTKKPQPDLESSVSAFDESGENEVSDENIKDFSRKSLQAEIRDFKYSFLDYKSNANQTAFNKLKDERDIEKDFSFDNDYKSDLRKNRDSKKDTVKRDGFNWRGAFGQSLMFLGVQHGYAVLGQQKTRDALKGKFWQDYADSVKSLHGWDDGGKFFTNYVAHPLQGAFTGFIYVQNSPQARREQFSMTEKYWKTRMKAMLWTAAWSTQFEIGPISQASIGNVGLKGKQTWEDIVVTPTLGTAFLVGEDFFDQYIIKAIERRTNNFYVKIFARMIFNPSRNFSNMFRFKAPWYRDRPVAD